MVLSLVLLCVPAFAEEGRVVLTSLEWPPYSGESLCCEGASSTVVRAAFKAVGYDVEIRFYPWRRAIDEALSNSDVVGYFPEYHEDERTRSFFFSNSIGKSPLGLAGRKDRGIHWDEIIDLQKYTIGVVKGYVNTERMDELIESKVLKVDKSNSDVLNLRKVLARRTDAAVVDINVYNYLMDNDAMLRYQGEALQLDSRLLAVHDIFVCFRKGEEGERIVRLFNEGLSAIEPFLIQRRYIQSAGSRH